MLLGLDPVLGPDLLHALAVMGHGDRIVLVDANYPATRGRRLIAVPGADAPRTLSSSRGSHGPGCGCCSGRSSRLVKRGKGGTKSFPTSRPWMISH